TGQATPRSEDGRARRRGTGGAPQTATPHGGRGGGRGGGSAGRSGRRSRARAEGARGARGVEGRRRGTETVARGARRRAVQGPPRRPGSARGAVALCGGRPRRRRAAGPAASGDAVRGRAAPTRDPDSRAA